MTLINAGGARFSVLIDAGSQIGLNVNSLLNVGVPRFVL